MLAVVIIAAILAFVPRMVWKVLGYSLLGIFIFCWLAEPPTAAEKYGHVVLHKVDAREIVTSTSMDTNGNHMVTVTNNSDLLIQNILMTCTDGGEEYQIRLNVMVYPHSSESDSVYDFRGGYQASCSISDWDNYRASPKTN